MSETMNEIGAFLDQGRPFEVIFDGDKATVKEVKGIVKITLSKEETKGIKKQKRGGRKIPRDQKAFLSQVSEILVRSRVPFKVTFGPKESTLRFDLDHYLHIYPEKSSLVGFRNMDEKPVVLIKGLVVDLPNFKILSPKS